jgi:hypothetical protein
MMWAMIHSTLFRLVALVLVAVRVVVAGTPAPAEAIDAPTIVAIVGLAAAGLILIAYLVIANVEGGSAAGDGRVVWMACAADDGCAAIPAETATALLEPTLAAADRQGP